MATRFYGSDRSVLAEDFQESLTSIETIEKLPPDFATEQKNGRFVDVRMSEVVKTPGLYFDNVPLRPGEGAAEFRYMPDLEPGKEKSVNQVFFGELTILDAVAAVTPLTVAVKRRFDMAGFAVHEFGAHKHVNNSGLITTFQPLGFSVSEKDGKPSIHLLTLFEPDIQSFDNLSWEVTEADIDEPTPKIERRLQELGWAGIYLAAPHSIGLPHGDAQPQNIALSSRDHSLMLTDLEAATILKDSDGNWQATEYDLVQAFQKDVSVFMKAIRRAGFLRGVGRAVTERVLNQYFFSPYSSRLSHPSSAIHSVGGIDVPRLIDSVAQTTFDQLDFEDA